MIAVNFDLGAEIEVLATELRLRDGSASLKVLPAKDVVGAHGKSAAFIGYDEIHAYKDWALMEASARSNAARLFAMDHQLRIAVQHGGRAVARSDADRLNKQRSAPVVFLVQRRSLHRCGVC